MVEEVSSTRNNAAAPSRDADTPRGADPGGDRSAASTKGATGRRPYLQLLAEEILGGRTGHHSRSSSVDRSGEGDTGGLQGQY